jgi:RNA polymerase sigma-70 factor (ECF subfamily)
VKDDSVKHGGASISTSLGLLERVRARDQSAWERLVELYAPLVFEWCLRSGLQHADAADLGQEVFVAVARKINDFRRDRPGDTFRGWLFTITRNKIRDRRHPPGTIGAGGSDIQRQMHDVPGLNEDDADSSDRNEPREDKILLHRAIGLVRREFESRSWDAFWRTFVDDEPAAEVAAALGMTPNAVYVAKSKVLRRLREEYETLFEF